MDLCFAFLNCWLDSDGKHFAISARAVLDQDVNWGGGCIFMCSFSVRRVSFQIEFKLPNSN